jgi:hypothetical protein
MVTFYIEKKKIYDDRGIPSGRNLIDRQRKNHNIKACFIYT